MKPSDDLTADQFKDLARHFMGAAWEATVFLHPVGKWYELCHRTTRETHAEDSIRAVFRSAGVRLPLRSRFTAHGTTVMHNGEAVATAKSANFAQRISSALNHHTPNRRGI